MTFASRAVLLVDDEADLLATYGRLLRRRGFEVVPVGTRKDALAAMPARAFGLVVTDVRLPDGDGLDVVRAAHGSTSPTPVIVVTGFPSGPGRRAALEAGASAYLAKPFSTVDFVALVSDLANSTPSTPPALT